MSKIKSLSFREKPEPRKINLAPSVWNSLQQYHKYAESERAESIVFDELVEKLLEIQLSTDKDFKKWQKNTINTNWKLSYRWVF